MQTFFGKLQSLFSRRLSSANFSDRVYLDYAAATPVHPQVVETMKPYWSEQFANAGAIHREGAQARVALESARTKIARLCLVRPELVTFTSGGTESNNLAIIGYVETLHAAGRLYDSMEIFTTPIEHPATEKALQMLAVRGVKVKKVPVDDRGRVHPETILGQLTEQTIMVTLAHINSEIGTIQPTQQIARVLRRYEREHDQSRIVLHIDAAQSPLWQTIQLPTLGADMLSLDAGKCEGPKGIGVLVCAQKQYITHGILYGGGQERGLRSGTEPVALCVGCAKALELAQATYESRSSRVSVLRDTFYGQLTERVPEAIWNGAYQKERVANNINFSLPGYDTEYAAIVLDAAGFAVSTKSACGTSQTSVSDVVYAISKDESRSRSPLRITLHEEVTEQQLRRLVDILSDHLDKMRPFKEDSL